MRIGFIGAGGFTVTAARSLLKAGHEVVIVEEDRERLDQLEEEDLDCGLVHGDGSRPAILKELGPENTDFLFCMSSSDQDNILAGLAGGGMGFGRCVVMISDPDFEPLCAQLGLEDVLVPSQETANAVMDRVSGIESVDLAPLLDAGLRFFCFVAEEGDAGPISELDLPHSARVLALVRDEEVVPIADRLEICEGDRIYVSCLRGQLNGLRDRFLRE